VVSEENPTNLIDYIDEKKCQFRPICQRNFIQEMVESNYIIEGDNIQEIENESKRIINAFATIENNKENLISSFSILSSFIAESLIFRDKPFIIKALNLVLDQKLNPMIFKLHTLDSRVKSIEDEMILLSIEKKINKELEIKNDLFEHSLLEKKYHGKFLAILNNEVIEMKDSLEELHRLLKEKFPQEKYIHIRYIDKGG